MSISIIVAMSENNVIGKDNELPWHMPNDLKHFKEITMGKPILMGRKTFESIGRPLPGRMNIILSSDPAYLAPGCIVISSVEELEQVVSSDDETMVIGGAKVFAQFLEVASKLYLTRIHTQVDGDVFFPDFRLEDWQQIDDREFETDEQHEFAYSFSTYTR